MTNGTRIAIFAGVAIVVASVLVAKGAPREQLSPTPRTATGIPTLIELGSLTCVPCKMMEEVLDELRGDYADRLNVQFVNVNADSEAAQKYGVRVIPTQVFLDSQGDEIYRHQGYFPTEDILKTFAEHGVSLQ